MVQGAADTPRPPLAPRWEPSAVSPPHQSAPFPACRDLLGCHNWQTQLKASLRQKKLLRAALGVGGQQSVEGSREQMKGLAVVAQQAPAAQELPHAGAETKEQATKETFKPRTVSGQTSTELTHQLRRLSLSLTRGGV